MFDLEKAIRAWRRGYEYRHAFTREDLKELECHLRDEIDGLRAEGLSEQVAFEQAVRDVGDYATTEDEYRKVFWEKAHHQGNLILELLWRGAMLTNYFKIALRNFKRHKGYTFLNVSGLAVGLACCLLILLYVRDELSYDRFHEHAGRIHKLHAMVKYSDLNIETDGMPDPMAPAMANDLTTVEQATRLVSKGLIVMSQGEERRSEVVYYTSPAFFEVFTFPLLRGDPETALAEPFSLLITEEKARLYFGEADPVGRTLTFHDSTTYRITGVLENVPHNSHLHFGMLSSFETLRALGDDRVDQWRPFGRASTYVLLAEGYTPDDLFRQLPPFLEQHMGEQGKDFKVGSERLTDLYLRSERVSKAQGLSGDIRYVWLFSGIAALILLIACINYMNLATARAAQRAKEVGIHKVVGARWGQLTRRFLSESILLCLVALGLALLLVALALPGFNSLIGKNLQPAYFSDPWLLPGLLGLVVLVGVLAGSYPAFLLARFRPTQVLKGVFQTGKGSTWLRRGLATFQFALSVGLILCTVVMLRQLEFMQTKKLGLEPEQIVSISASGQPDERYEAFKHLLRQQPNVLRVTAGEVVGGSALTVFAENAPMRPSNGVLRTFWVDYGFVETLGIELIAGRSFSEDVVSDANRSILLNEAAVRDFGWDDPIGQTLRLRKEDPAIYEVIGVIKDFHYNSMREAIEPAMIRIGPSRDVLAKISSEDIPGTLEGIRRAWRQLEPVHAFTYQFLDEQYDRLYRSERRISNLFGVAAGLAIFIASLGLFGLAAFTAEQRTREIGIRKVLGASVPQIVVLLTRQFAALVLAAFVAAAPVGYLIMHGWLEDFAYRVELSWPIFLIAGLAAFLVALGTVSYQAIRAALADPVKSLRYE